MTSLTINVIGKLSVVTWRSICYVDLRIEAVPLEMR